MKHLKNDIAALIGIILLTLIISFDLYSHTGIPATMDGIIHITIIEQFYRAIQAGNFPVTWLDKYANYGLPVPLYAQQLPAYIGAFLTFLTHNPVTSFDILVVSSLLLSASLYYVFLRFYFRPLLAFTGVVMLSLAPYRLTDIYIRADLPELMAAIFLPVMLIGIYLLIQKQRFIGFYLILFTSALLTLCHPMMLVVFAFFYLPYIVYLLWSNNLTNALRLKLSMTFLFSWLIGIGIASYYIIPLKLEMKYFYFGHSDPVQGNFNFNWANVFLERWPSHVIDGISTRVQVIQTGIIETLILAAGIVWSFKAIFLDKQKKLSLLSVSVLSACLILFFALPYSAFIYQHTLLQDIQFPWRMLAVFIFIPPLILAVLLNQINNKSIRLGAVITLVSILLIIRLPVSSGRDYINHPLSTYEFTADNLNLIMMNTIWTGKTESYPIEKEKAAIISGKGVILQSKVNNSSRQYVVKAKTPIRMVDYTFYFPGWSVKIDGHTVPIQFQDPAYRGVITYDVPIGKHIVDLSYQPTLVRRVADVLTFIFLATTLILLIMNKRLNDFVYKTS